MSITGAKGYDSIATSLIPRLIAVNGLVLSYHFTKKGIIRFAPSFLVFDEITGRT